MRMAVTQFEEASCRLMAMTGRSSFPSTATVQHLRHRTVIVSFLFLKLLLAADARNTGRGDAPLLPAVRVTPDYTDSTDCSGFMTIVGNTASSPNFPRKYPSNMDCRRILTAPPGHVILVEFVHLAMEVSRSCQYDFFEVRDGMFGYSPMLARVCGRSIPRTLRSTDRWLWIRMKTDEMVEEQGVSITITVLKDGSALHRIHGGGDRTGKVVPTIYNTIVYASDEGTISTSDIPFQKLLVNHTGVPVDCSWDIRAESNATMFVTFSKLAVASSSLSWICSEADGLVEVYDGGTSQSELMRRECFVAPAALVTRSSRLVVHVRTAGNTASLDFSFTYTKFYDTSKCQGAFQCDDGHCISRDLACNGRANCKDQSDEHCVSDLEKATNEDFISWRYGLVLGVAAGATILLVTGVLVHNGRLRYKGEECEAPTFRLRRNAARSLRAMHACSSKLRRPCRPHLTHPGDGGVDDRLCSPSSDRAQLRRLDSSGTQARCASCGAASAAAAAAKRQQPQVVRSQTTDSSVTEQTTLSSGGMSLCQLQLPPHCGGTATPLIYFTSPYASVDEERDASYGHLAGSRCGRDLPPPEAATSAATIETSPDGDCSDRLLPIGDGDEAFAAVAGGTAVDQVSQRAAVFAAVADAVWCEEAAAPSAQPLRRPSTSDLVYVGSGGDGRLPPLDLRRPSLSATAAAAAGGRSSCAARLQRPLTREARVCDDRAAGDCDESEPRPAASEWSLLQ